MEINQTDESILRLPSASTENPTAMGVNHFIARSPLALTTSSPRRTAHLCPALVRQNGARKCPRQHARPLCHRHWWRYQYHVQSRRRSLSAVCVQTVRPGAGTHHAGPGIRLHPLEFPPHHQLRHQDWRPPQYQGVLSAMRRTQVAQDL